MAWTRSYGVGLLVGVSMSVDISIGMLGMIFPVVHVWPFGTDCVLHLPSEGWGCIPRREPARYRGVSCWPGSVRFSLRY